MTAFDPKRILESPRTFTASDTAWGRHGHPQTEAWHGFREFLKDYAIIVVDVLTALAAEQAVEPLRWMERVDAAGCPGRLAC